MPPFWPHFQPSFLAKYALCTSHSDLMGWPEDTRDAPNSRSCALTVPLGLHFLLKPRPVLCSGSPLPSSLSEHPCLNVHHLLWLCLCLFPTLVLTTHLLFVTHCLLLHWRATHEGKRAERFCLLWNPAFQQCVAHHRWLGQMCWRRKVNGVSFVMLYTVVYSSSWNTWYPQPPGFLSIKLSCFRWVGPGICWPSQTPSAMYIICSSHSGWFSQGSMSFQMSMPLCLLIHLPKLTFLILLPSNLYTHFRIPLSCPFFRWTSLCHLPPCCLPIHFCLLVHYLCLNSYHTVLQRHIS